MIKSFGSYFGWACAVMIVCLAGCADVLTAPKPGVAVEDMGPVVQEQTDATQIRVKTLVHGLKEPWGMDFLPDGRLLITEKAGALKVVDFGSGRMRDIAGIPEVADAGQGGLMDVLVHPEFAENGLIYLSYAIERSDIYTTRVSRARLEDHELQNLEVLFTAAPFFKERRHFGSRLLLDDGYLYITVGDRGNRDMAQSLASHNGKVMRLFENGEIPPDNPFIGKPGAFHEIWTYGHRNPQGLALHPLNGAIWVNEHGPQGGDEINALIPGANYGWPVITYGEEYGGGKIGEGTQKEGMEQPLAYYATSIGTSGMDFYQGDSLPGWKPSVVIGGLRSSEISRLELEGDGVGRRTRMLSDLKLRIRDVQFGPDGYLYALAGGSRLIRLQVEQ